MIHTQMHSEGLTMARDQDTRASVQAHEDGPAGVNGAQILAIIERVERLDAEIKELNADKSEVFKEAKGNGYDVSVIKQMIKERRQDPSERAEKETILDLYTRAVEAVG